MGRIKAIRNHKGLCWKCLKDNKETRVIEIPELGFGSGFDGSGTEIHLCPICYELSKDLWNLKVVYEDEYYEKYENEDEIFKYLKELPVESQQFVFNEFEKGWNSRHIPPQVWMDYFVNKCLSHSDAKRYGLYSLQEIKAYQERFPKCVFPVNRVFSDNSIGCWCPFGATGEKDQKIGLNISSECYKCQHFRERKENEVLRNVKEGNEWYRYEIESKYNEDCKER